MKEADALIDPIIDLPAEAMERLMEMLENPREPSPALKALFRKHKSREENAAKTILAAQAAGQSLEEFMAERNLPPQAAPYIALLWRRVKTSEPGGI